MFEIYMSYIIKKVFSSYQTYDNYFRLINNQNPGQNPS